MSQRPEPLRCALAQINSTVGDIAGNADRIAAATVQARERGARAGRLPGARADRLPARGPAAQAALPRRRRRGARRARGPDDRHRRARRLPRARRRRLQLCGRAGRRPRRRRLPQAAPAELRRLRRAALLPGRPVARDRRGQRRHRRPHDLRGHLGARPAGDRRGARPAPRSIVNLSASPYHHGKGLAARADARPARPRQPRLGALLQRRRRPGRAGLRRPQRRDRPDRRGRRARAAVRGGAHRLHDRPRRGRRRPAARPAPPRRRSTAPRAGGGPGVERLGALRASSRATIPGVGQAAGVPRAAARARGRGLHGARDRRARLRRQERLRARRCSGSPAGSTRRSPPWSPSTRSAPTA